MGTLLGWAIQLFVTIPIMLPYVQRNFIFAKNHPKAGELLFKSVLVILTFLIVELVPNLTLLVTLIGAVGSSVLALVLPPLLEFNILACEGIKISWFVILKNVFMLLLAFVGFLCGGYESITGIYKIYVS